MLLILGITNLFFSIWINRGLAILPSVNLVTNIGFSENSTHTNNPNNKYSNIPTQNILPLKHPSTIERNLVADEYFYKIYNYKSPLRILYRLLRRIIKN